MRTGRAVTIIPATTTLFSSLRVGVAAKKRVAAYARVSTETEEQRSSYEAQVDYYTRYIQEKENWEFIDVYSDEGISATNTKRRGGFKRMIADSLNGKIDMIITKSVSRFARNTVDTLTTVRQLKEKGVEVYFEKENIYTLDSKGELLITIMSSLAQEESRSISENVTWGQRKRFADGKVNLPYGHFLGFEKGKDGLPKIVESEAVSVRLIYRLFLEGKTPSGIAKHLTQSGVPTPSGKIKWPVSTVESILTNEKYKGDTMLQKTFTEDFMTGKKRKNIGQRNKYYVKDSHAAIVSAEVFDKVQEEMAKRARLVTSEDGNVEISGNKYNGKYLLGNLLVCGDCGTSYRRRTERGKVVWRCAARIEKGKEVCLHSPTLDEGWLQDTLCVAICQNGVYDEGVIRNEVDKIQVFDTFILIYVRTELIFKCLFRKVSQLRICRIFQENAV